MNKIKRARVYRHFKGGYYYVVGIAQHSETGEKLVIYIDCDSKTFEFWVRPVKMFVEKVKIDGRTVPRFKLVCEVPEEYRKWLKLT